MESNSIKGNNNRKKKKKTIILTKKQDGGTGNVGVNNVANNNNSKKGGSHSNQNRNQRGRRSKAKKSSGGGQSRGPPQTPTMKLTIRNIRNADKYSTVQDIGDMIRVFIGMANDRLFIQSGHSSSSTSIEQRIGLDEEALQQLIRDDEAFMEVRDQWKKSVTPSATPEGMVQDGGAITSTSGHDGGVTTNLMENEDQSQMKSHIVSLVEGGQVAEDSTSSLVKGVVDGMQLLCLDNNSNGSISQSLFKGVSARIICIIPPKKTHRRGEKPGCAYVVLTAPPIEVRTAQKNKIPQPQPALPLPPQNSESLTNPVTVPTDAAVVSTAESVATSTTSASVDYSRDVAQRRLLLVRAMEALVQVAQEDALYKKVSKMDCVMIEESPNAKTWRPNIRRHDRFEGTIEESADYIQFLEMVEQEREARKSRPKPTPGGGVMSGGTSTGGVSAASTTTGAASGEQGQPVAALVLHLQKKREGEKAKKGKKQSERSVKEASVTKSGKKAKNSGKEARNKNVKSKKKKKQSKETINATT